MDEFELYATESRWEDTASGTIPYVVVTRTFPPMPDDEITYHEIDSHRAKVGLMKTGRVARLRIARVECVVPPFYVVGVQVLAVGECVPGETN